MANNQLYAPDIACIPINPALSCGEEWRRESDDDDDDAPITFYIKLPPQHDRLNFSSRDKSAGVLLPTEQSLSDSKEEDECDDNRNDPFFFSPGFYLEAKTGFQPWPGARLMLEAFACDMKNDRIKHWQTKLRNKDYLNVLEVGGGIGIVGTCLASQGARVTITDLPVLVDHGIIPNLRRNAKSNDTDSNEKDYMQIGEGYARATVLDWLKPISEQLSKEAISNFDVIIGCDCLFLEKLVDPFLDMIKDLFDQSTKRPTLLFTYQRRNMEGVFSTLEDVLKRMKIRGWSVDCLAWRSITVEGDGEHDLYLFEAGR